ncbi:hypothetical protein M8C21_030147, partial [Ambrosia artemisiifolia]
VNPYISSLKIILQKQPQPFPLSLLLPLSPTPHCHPTTTVASLSYYHHHSLTLFLPPPPPLFPLLHLHRRTTTTGLPLATKVVTEWEYLEQELNSGYRLPPSEIRDIVDAPPLPALSFSPKRDKIMFLKRRSLRPLSELAKPEDKLAGIRIDGNANSRSRISFYTGIGIHDLKDDGTLGPEKLIHGFPEGSKINSVNWYSPSSLSLLSNF